MTNECDDMNINPDFSHALQQQVDALPHAQKERLAFIDFSLQYFGHISRTELIARFKTGLAAATRDFAQYRSIAPENLILIHQTKSYYRTYEFISLFVHEPQQVLTALAQGFGNGIASDKLASEQCFDAVRLIHPDTEIIAAIMRSIHQGSMMNCRYVSVSSGEGERDLVPHALINNGHRWHVRAYDRQHQAFRDFVCTRFTYIANTDEPVHPHESAQADSQFNELVTLSLIPHPSLESTLAIEMDYSMVDGKVDIHVRACVAAYVLRQWQVDCSQNSRISGQGCQLALANLEVLSKIENVTIAPGARQ